jgi:glucosamine-6-phosphate deaminase
MERIPRTQDKQATFTMYVPPPPSLAILNSNLTHLRRLIIRPSAASASLYVAHLIRARINAFSPTAPRPFVLGLPTGSSPLLVYKYLISFHRSGTLSFRHVITFNMDEYVGLPRDHQQSYHTFMHEHLFAHIDILPENAHLLNPLATDLEEEARRYEAAIQAVGGIRLFLAGVGTDGHIAFNEPGSSLSSRTRVKTLASQTRADNARFFGGDLEKVPRTALTVGVGTIMAAHEVVVIATGAAKARAVRDGVEGAVGHLCTMSALQWHANAVVVVDEDATAELRVKTVKVCGYV